MNHWNFFEQSNYFACCVARLAQHDHMHKFCVNLIDLIPLKKDINLIIKCSPPGHNASFQNCHKFLILPELRTAFVFSVDELEFHKQHMFHSEEQLVWTLQEVLIIERLVMYILFCFNVTYLQEDCRSVSFGSMEIKLGRLIIW